MHEKVTILHKCEKMVLPKFPKYVIIHTHCKTV